MKRFLSLILALLFLAGNGLAQSPNLSGSISRLDLANYQLRSQKDAASGYVGLSASSLINPVLMFPDFNSSADGTIWAKSGVTLAPFASSVINSDGLTVQGVRVGKFNAETLYGVSQDTAARPLILKAGTSTNSVYIYYGHTIGGANSGHSAFRWSIGPTGTFSLAGGQLSADLDMNVNDITEVLTISGMGLTISYAAGTIVGATGLDLSATTGGVTVPDTTTVTAGGRALNRTSADSIYGDLAGTNTWAAIQTFTAQPVFTVPLSLNQTSGLEAALALKLPLAGGTMAGAIAMGTSKITGLGEPSSAQDAATKNYVDSKTTASTGGTLTDLTVSGSGLVKSMAGNVTNIELLSATSGRNGYLTSTDWALFNAKAGALSATPPLDLTSGVLSMAPATTSAPGYLTDTDWDTFNNKESALSFSAPLVRTTNTISLAASSDIADGYMSAADHVLLTGKAPKASPAFTGTVTMANALEEAYGGTGESSYMSGEILVGNVAGGLTKTTIASGTGITVTSGTASISIANAGSYALALPTSIFDIADSPLTGAGGTITATFDTQTANTVFAGPTTGVAATPTMRALVAADLPTASVAKGGTGADFSATVAGKFLYTSSTGVFSAATVTTEARALLDDTTALAQRTTLGMIVGSDSLTYASVASHSYEDQDIFMPSDVSANDPVILGLPEAFTAGIVYQAWVSDDASDIVTVRATNITAGAVTPSAGTYKVIVIH